jgi:hypothetical protein
MKYKTGKSFLFSPKKCTVSPAIPQDKESHDEDKKRVKAAKLYPFTIKE